MQPMSGSSLNVLKPLELHGPVQQPKASPSHCSSLQTSFYKSDRYKALKDNKATEVYMASTGEKGDGSDKGDLSRRVTMDGIVKKHELRRVGEIDREGKRKISDLERAHNAPNLLQLHSQAVEAGYENISDRMDNDPEWGGNLGHWVIDTIAEARSTHQSDEFRPSSIANIIDNWEAFDDFDGVFALSDKDSQKMNASRTTPLQKSVNYELHYPLTIDDETIYPADLIISDIPADARAESRPITESNPLSTMALQKQSSAPQSEPEKPSVSFQEGAENNDGATSKPGKAAEQTSPADPPHHPDWPCPRCGFSNFARRTACMQCWLERDELLGSSSQRDRHVTFAKPKKFEGKYASAMKGYDASLVDASLIPEPLSLKSCLKKAPRKDTGKEDKKTQPNSNPNPNPNPRGFGGPASGRKQEATTTTTTTAPKEADQTAADISLEEDEIIQKMERIVVELCDNKEIVRGAVEGMIKIREQLEKED
ncbi:uncharacterized protein F4812DRAFT_428404 [Daldinia caldariorum]|uniref:uncharacterized protein n=1 Tax=Daldinia caldariorum TaxID=326644 RepID=UPI00200802A1|nr:uncharacterized protein F4812DRAFT_428404 [Daldinia caldariorum]KAI1467997.1 hypothetical protein F4812DRAFT_428404 [Daldinia caldariorum]